MTLTTPIRGSFITRQIGLLLAVAYLTTKKRILTRDGSKDAFSRKDVPFGGKMLELTLNPFYAPKGQILAKKQDLENFWPKTLYNGGAYLQTTLNRHHIAP